jgi:AraC-like DNA-binding protein
MRRVEAALTMLTRGTSAAEVAHRVGYADQPHLVRSLKRLVGQTPTQIAASAADAPLSLRFKTVSVAHDYNSGPCGS